MNPDVDALLLRFDELVREKADLTARMRAIDMGIATLKRAAEILSPEAASAQPLRQQPFRKAGDGRASLTKAMLEVLREAPAPLTAFEVGTMALARLGGIPAPITRSVLTSRVTTAMSKSLVRGTVRRIEEAGAPLRWCVAR